MRHRTRHALGIVTMVLAGLHAHCRNEPSSGGAGLSLSPGSLRLEVGASETVAVDGEDRGTYTLSGCDDLVSLPDGATVRDFDFTVIGKAVGTCRLAVTANESGKASELPIEVVAANQPPEPTETPICTVPVGKGEELEGRAIYRAEVDLDADPGTCAVRTAGLSSRDHRLTVGFLSGSPGYSLNPRFDYRVLTAVPGNVTKDGFSADLLEGNVIDATVGTREAPDAGPSTWSLRFKMNADPDPAKWTVTLYRFDKS